MRDATGFCNEELHRWPRGGDITAITKTIRHLALRQLELKTNGNATLTPRWPLRAAPPPSCNITPVHL